MNVLSQFSKGAANAVGLSFALSGSPDCDRRCAFHPNRNGGCYAHRLEAFRESLRSKLERHEELGPEVVTETALAELKLRRSLGEDLTWLRISPFGPVPKSANATTGFLDRLRELFAYCQSKSIAVHFPVESASKCNFYQPVVADLGVTVRQSIQSLPRFLGANTVSAFTAGIGLTGPGIREQRRQAARRAARRRYERTGRKTVVCPYDATPQAPRAKCGLCRACADPKFDVVYLKH